MRYRTVLICVYIRKKAGNRVGYVGVITVATIFGVESRAFPHELYCCSARRAGAEGQFGLTSSYFLLVAEQRSGIFFDARYVFCLFPSLRLSRVPCCVLRLCLCLCSFCFFYLHFLSVNRPSRSPAPRRSLACCTRFVLLRSLRALSWRLTPQVGFNFVVGVRLGYIFLSCSTATYNMAPLLIRVLASSLAGVAFPFLSQLAQNC